MFQLVHTQPPAICQTDQLRKSSYQSVAAAAGAPGELISAVTLCPLGSPDVRVAAFPATAVLCCAQEKSLSLSFLRFFFQIVTIRQLLSSFRIRAENWKPFL